MEPTNSPVPTPKPPTAGNGAFREGTPPMPRPAPRGSALKYGIALMLLVAVIGVIAWVAQNSPKPSKDPKPAPAVSKVKLLDFPRTMAKWDDPKANDAEGDSNKELILPKDFEFGTAGHYDFPFTNVSGKEIEILHYVSTCDCTSVQACALPMSQVKKLIQEQKAKPGEPLAYEGEPGWLNLQSEREQSSHSDAKRILKVQADEGGVVRMVWKVKKTPGQVLKLNPHVVFRPVGDTDTSWRQAQTLMAPVLVGTALRFEPAMVNVGLLAPGKSATAEFDAWSSTREKFDLELSAPHNPFFEIKTRPLTPKECEDLASNLKTDKVAPRVLSGHHVTITVYETKENKQLDQGPFYQKLAIKLNGFDERELPGPEIRGRVQGDIRVGGTDDFGKIMFKAFTPGETAQKTVELLADAKIELEPYNHEPSWLEVDVKRSKEQPDPKQHRWRLRVTIPAETPGVRSFEETDHVTLKIKNPGAPDRKVRIAIFGQLIGR